jgi:uncharacterized protein
MEVIRFLTQNRIIDMAFLAWLIAQVLKIIIELALYHKVNWVRIWESGGMPSSHSSCVVACAVSAGKLYGLASPVFGVAVILAMIVMYDAMNVRRTAGDMAKIVNYMMEHWTEMKPDMFGNKLKELLGHTPIQVFFGALLGFIIGLLA